MRTVSRADQRLSFDITDVTGRTRRYLTRLTPEFGDDGRSVESVLAVSSDETERVRLDHARDAVEAALRDADRRKNEFIATRCCRCWAQAPR